MENVLNRWKNSLAPKGSARFFQVFPWVWLIAAYCMSILWLYLCGRSYIDSDMSSEIVLANLLNQEGKIGLFTKSWWYSTEIETIFPIFYRLGLLVFSHDWYAARILGQALMMAVLVLSYLYVGHGLKFKNCGVWGAAALVCPFSVWYLWYGILGGYYFPYMIMWLISFGAMLHLLEPSDKKVRNFLRWFLLVGSSALFGVTSVKGLMAFYLPMGVTAFAIFILKWREDPRRYPKRGARMFALATISILASGTGYLINSTIIAENYRFLNYNKMTWAPIDVSAILQKWADFLGLFGYLGGDAFLEPDVPIFSLSGILGAFGVLTAVAIVISLIRLLWHWREMQDIQLIVPILFTVALLEQGFIFACTSGVGTVAPSHWLPVVPLAFMVLQLEGETEHFKLPCTRKTIAVVFFCCMISTSIGAIKNFPTTGYVANPHLESVCDWLVDHDYTQGYASFWNANVMTEWSSGQIEVWVAPDFKRMDRIYEWLQKASHENLPEGKIFLLTTEQELNEQKVPDLPSVSQIVYQEDEAISKSGRYIIMEYESAEAMMETIETVKTK